MCSVASRAHRRRPVMRYTKAKVVSAVVDVRSQASYRAVGLESTLISPRTRILRSLGNWIMDYFHFYSVPLRRRSVAGLSLSHNFLPLFFFSIQKKNGCSSCLLARPSSQSNRQAHVLRSIFHGEFQLFVFSFLSFCIQRFSSFPGVQAPFQAGSSAGRKLGCWCGSRPIWLMFLPA